jgi:ceramide glucosyltransferase
MGFVELAVLAGIALLGGLVWREQRALRRAMRPRPRPPALEQYPSISVIRPVKGLDVELDQNLRSALQHGYPGAVQTIFVFDHEREPALPMVEKAIAEHLDSGRPGSAEIVYCGQPPHGRTGKLNAMIQGARQAKGELVAFADSDIRSDASSLRLLVETLLGSERAGAAFAPVVVSEYNQTLFDAVCATMLNGLYTPYACRELRRNDGELPFLLGQLMVFTRETLEAIGGLEQVSGQLVDDLYIGQLVRRAGLRNLASPEPIRIIQSGLPVAEGYRRYERWVTFSRTGIPQWSFKLPIMFRAPLMLLGLVGGVAAATQGMWLATAAGLSLGVGVIAAINALHNRTGCAPLRPRHWLSPLVIVLLAPWALFRVYVLQRRMAWRGRVYGLRAGRLDVAVDPAAPTTRRIDSA